MLTKILIKKMFITSSIVIIILLVYFMPGVVEVDNNFKTSVEYVDLTNNIVYLVDGDGFLVESTISTIDVETDEDKIRDLLNHLSDASNEIIPNGLNHVFNSKISLIGVFVDENIASLNFSNDVLELDNKELIRFVEAVSYTIINNLDINGVGIYVDNKLINTYVDIDIPDIITKDFGINKMYHFNKTDDIVKYVVYYTKIIDGNRYYVPVTKYINSDDDKINIIIKDLSSSYIYQPNLVSIVSEEIELLNSNINNNEMVLDFSNSIFLDNYDIKEEVVYPFVSTILSNYDVESVVFRANGEEILKKTKKNG